jgi:hypothetical protein
MDSLQTKIKEVIDAKIDTELEKIDDIYYDTDGYDKLKIYLESSDNLLCRNETYPETYYELDPDKIKEFVHSSIPKLIEIVREDEKEICICAAIQMKDGTIIRGHRHSDAMRTSEQIPKYRDEKMFSGTQGFITSKNRYVGRVEGAKLQKEAGIKSKMPEGQEYLHGELYSEDLY